MHIQIIYTFPVIKISLFYRKNARRVPVENTIKLSEQLCFLSSVRVSDLDPKSVHSIEKHRQRDVDIFDAVISSLEENILFKNGLWE